MTAIGEPVTPPSASVYASPPPRVTRAHPASRFPSPTDPRLPPSLVSICGVAVAVAASTTLHRLEPRPSRREPPPRATAEKSSPAIPTRVAIHPPIAPRTPPRRPSARQHHPFEATARRRRPTRRRPPAFSRVVLLSRLAPHARVFALPGVADVGSPPRARPPATDRIRTRSTAVFGEVREPRTRAVEQTTETSDGRARASAAPSTALRRRSSDVAETARARARR